MITLNRTIGSSWLEAFFLTLILILGLSANGFAAEYNVGAYKVEVDVRTSLMKIISHATVKCSLSGKTIRISAYAPGYVSQKKEILVTPGVSKYFQIIQLPDPQKRLDVLDFNHKPIASSYFDRFQGNTPTDRYAITMFLPIKSWPHPLPENVKVNQPGYGWPIQESCEISKYDEFYRVRMLIDRAVLDDPHDELLVYVNTSEVLQLNAIPWWIKTLAQLEISDSSEAERLARILIFVMPEEFYDAPMPKALSRLIAQRRRFNVLHKDQ